MSVHEWLATPINTGGRTVLSLLAELVGKNGSLTVRGWGFQTFGDGPYGVTGLEQDEALHLIELNGVLVGFQLAQGSQIYEEVVNAIKDEIKRHVETQKGLQGAAEAIKEFNQ